MRFLQHRVRLTVIGLGLLLLVVFAIRDSKMASDSMNLSDIGFVFATCGFPFLVFAFFVWTGRWGELAGGSGRRNVRQWTASTADVLGAISSGLFLLILPFWSILAAHEKIGGAWVLTGVFAAIAATLCALSGSPRRVRHGIVSALMVPCWLIVAALLARAMLD